MPKSNFSYTHQLGFLRYRKNGRLDVVNSIIPNMFGFKSEKSFLSSDKPEEIFIIVSKNNTSFEKSMIWTSFKFVFSKKDKSKLFAESYLLVNDGFVEVLINEIGIQEGLERALRESEEKSELTLDTLIDGIIIMSTNYSIESVNPAVENIFGYNAEELIGKNVFIFKIASS